MSVLKRIELCFENTDQKKIIYVFLFLSFFIKCIGSYFLPLFFDEAYYWVWSHHIDWSYFDHPPMVAYLFEVNSWFFSNPALSRIFAIAVSHLGVLPWLLILLNVSSNQQPRDNNTALKFLFLYLSNPITGLGAMIVTPDLPLLFFWGWSFYFAYQYLNTQKIYYAILIGVFLGLGFLSKYHMVLWALCALTLLICRQYREKIPMKDLIKIIFFGALTCSPVIYWNAINNWDSFIFQLNHGLKSYEFNLRWPAEYLLGQMFVLSPPVFFLLFKRTTINYSKQLLFYIFSALPIGFFFMTSFRAPVELNWASLAYPALFVIAAILFSTKKIMWISIYGFVLQAVLLQSVFSESPLVAHEKLKEPFYYSSIQKLPLEYTPFYASSYQMASSLWYLNQKPTYKLKGLNRRDMFDYWPPSAPKENEFYLLKDINLMFPVDFMPNWTFTKIPINDKNHELLYFKKAYDLGDSL